MVKETKKRGRKPNPFKGMTTLELRALEMQVSNELRTKRICIILQVLAKTKDKTFNIKRFEADLSDNIAKHRLDRIDESIEMLEILLDIV